MGECGFCEHDARGGHARGCPFATLHGFTKAVKKAQAAKRTTFRRIKLNQVFLFKHDGPHYIRLAETATAENGDKVTAVVVWSNPGDMPVGSLVHFTPNHKVTRV